jgi:hypothetical protein
MAMSGGPVRLATAAIASATASSAGAAATASWFDSPRPMPDEADPGDRVVRSLDLIGILLRHDKAEGENVLRRLAQRRRVDPRHGGGAFLAEELPRHGGAFCGRHDTLDGRVDGVDPLVHALQFGAHLPPAHRREADGHSLFCHRSDSLLSSPDRLTF